MRLLVVDDDQRMLVLLVRALREEGYAVDTARDGDEALWLALETEYDAIVLDRMLPGREGADVVRELRARGRTAPVLLLTALVGVAARIAGLDAGADDYLVKPFNFGELAARIRALVRRGPSSRPPQLANGDLTLDPATRQVHRDGERIDLTAKEFALLEQLLRHRGQVLSRTFIREHVWDFAAEVSSNVIDQYIASLRRKIDRPCDRSVVETVRGAGYRLVPVDPHPELIRR